MGHEDMEVLGALGGAILGVSACRKVHARCQSFRSNGAGGFGDRVRAVEGKKMGQQWRGNGTRLEASQAGESTVRLEADGRGHRKET